MPDPLIDVLRVVVDTQIQDAAAPTGCLRGAPAWCEAMRAAVPAVAWQAKLDPSAAAVDVCVMDTRGRSLPRTEIAHWRDLGADQLLVTADAGESARRELLALALSPVAHHDDVMVWGHHIADYKRTPDWLNPRFWANPERWGVERW